MDGISSYGGGPAVNLVGPKSGLRAVCGTLRSFVAMEFFFFCVVKIHFMV